jgi:hypothetical protein
MGNECLGFGAWWPLQVKRSALGRKLDKNPDRTMRSAGSEEVRNNGHMKFMASLLVSVSQSGKGSFFEKGER